ncbi:hypothetical protein BGZ98_008127 [Dissophora globulifera]|nr:hypothetical protein BGZ98_008127 [Dissophora globulifera]
MYVFGGFPSTATSTKATPQAFMLDLSVSWSADSPAFTRLPDGPVAPAQYGEITPDRQSWFTWLDGLGSVYDLKQATWSKFHLTAASKGKSNHTAGSDSGNALYSPNTDGSHKTITSIDLASKTYYTIPHPDSIYSIGYSLTWNAPLQSALFIGGTTGPLHRLDRLNLFLYNSTTGWSNLNSTATGTTPPPRYGACVASAYGGSKVILFGGYGSDTGSALSDIHILDVETMTWTQGPNTAPKQGRGFAVCSASSNYFIAWGGASDSKNANALNSTLVYDLAANNWVSSYTRHATFHYHYYPCRYIV